MSKDDPRKLDGKTIDLDFASYGFANYQKKYDRKHTCRGVRIYQYKGCMLLDSSPASSSSESMWLRDDTDFDAVIKLLREAKKEWRKGARKTLAIIKKHKAEKRNGGTFGICK